MKVRDCLARYLTEHVPHTASQSATELYAAYFIEHFGDRDVRDISHDDIWHPETGYVARRGRGEIAWVGADGRARGGQKAGTSTVRREIVALKAAIQHCTRIKEGGVRLVSLDDVPHIKLPPHGTPRIRWLLREEAGALLAAAQPKKLRRLSRLYRFVAAGLFTAARKEAIATLEWGRIHLQEENALDYMARLAAGEQPQARNLGVVDYRDGKIHRLKRRAIVPIMPEFAEVLLRAKKEARNRYYLDHPAFPRKAWERATREAGLYDVTPHMLRHTWATWAAQDSVPMFEIAGVLGDTVQTVERVYAHYDPQFMHKASNRRLLDSRVGVG